MTAVPQIWFSSSQWCFLWPCVTLPLSSWWLHDEPGSRSLDTECPALVPVCQVDGLPGSAACVCVNGCLSAFLQFASDLNGTGGPGKPAHTIHLTDAQEPTQHPTPQSGPAAAGAPVWDAHRALPPAQCLRRVCSNRWYFRGPAVSHTLRKTSLCSYHSAGMITDICGQCSSYKSPELWLPVTLVSLLPQEPENPRGIQCNTGRSRPEGFKF